MKYMGSKSRIINNILPIIQSKIEDYNIKTYVEPFCGGCNVIDKVSCKIKIASDNHKYLIAMYQNLDKLSELPDFVTKEHYSEVRDCFNKKETYYPDWYIGAIGFWQVIMADFSMAVMQDWYTLKQVQPEIIMMRGKEIC